jgi:hypothetical protein
MIRYCRHTLLLIAFIILYASPAYANAGLPMIVIVLPGMIVSLIPIILIEAWYIRRSLGITFPRAIKVMGIANLESTFIGIPITWIVLVMLEMFIGFLGFAGHTLFISIDLAIPDFVGYLIAITVGAAWLMPVGKEAYWMVPTAALVLLFPFFYVSWRIERNRAKKILQEIPPEKVNKATLLANIYSYGLLGIIVIGFLIKAVITKGIP